MSTRSGFRFWTPEVVPGAGHQEWFQVLDTRSGARCMYTRSGFRCWTPEVVPDAGHQVLYTRNCSRCFTPERFQVLDSRRGSRFGTQGYVLVICQ